jgi:hypothetical protein
MTETEVAVPLRCSVGNVKSQASSALAKLRVTLTFSDGRTATMRPIDAEGARFYVFALPKGLVARKVAYYAASGR